MSDQSDKLLQNLDKWLGIRSRHLSKKNEAVRKAKSDAQTVKNRAKELQNEMLSEINEGLKLDRKLKEDCAERIFKYLNWYTIVVFVILGIHGTVYIYQQFWGKGEGTVFVFDSWVLVALIGSIATGVFTSVNAVMKGLFGSDK